MELEKLDDKTLIDTFNRFTPDDLIWVAEQSQRFAAIILDHYIIGKYNLHEKEISVIVGRTIYLAFDTLERQAIPITTRYDQTLWTLQHFGHIFKHLSYQFGRFGNANSQEIINYVDKYCPLAPKTVTIFDVDSQTLPVWDYSFDHTTTHVTISGTTIDEPIELNRFFPHMQQLTIHYPKESITAILLHRFPELTTFSINAMFRVEDNANFYEFIRLNPQIRQFSTSMHNNETFMAFVNEMLPHLQSLSVRNEIRSYSFDANREIIHFKNVTKFALTLSSSHQHIRKFRDVGVRFAFDQLESFKLTTTEFTDAKELIPIIVANKGLKIVETNMVLEYSELVGLVEALPALQVLTIHWERYNTIGEMRMFLLENHALNRVNVRIHSNRVITEDLKRMTPVNWSVVEEKVFQWLHVVSFIRKY